MIRKLLFILFLFVAFMSQAKNSSQSVATFGGGCFWCIEAVFDALAGVESVESGYSGGKTVNPTYREVSSGETGHAEVVQIHYDPEIVSYTDLLAVFFSVHDPTTLNRQGPDVGTQYRSVIFYHDNQQKQEAENFIAELEQKAVYQSPIVTEITPAQPFYEAEDHHQDYYENNASQPYCKGIISPKLEKLKEKFGEKLKQEN